MDHNYQVGYDIIVKWKVQYNNYYKLYQLVVIYLVMQKCTNRSTLALCVAQIGLAG